MPQSTPDIKNKTREKILAEYKKKSEEILYQMYQVVTYTQRKIDDTKYRQALEKIKKVKFYG